MEKVFFPPSIVRSYAICIFKIEKKGYRNYNYKSVLMSKILDIQAKYDFNFPNTLLSTQDDHTYC